MNYKNQFLNFFFKETDFKNIPIIINNYNRLTTLISLLESLEKRGYTNIHILDNKSSYPPLLEFYKTINNKFKVHFLKKNYGYKALWRSGMWINFVGRYFCYTDSDLKIIDECPDNFLQYFSSILQKYPEVHKVGFSLCIDGLPDCYSKKNEVIEWEKKFYQNTKSDNLFIAPIDTTFALYRPFSKRGERDGSVEMIRIGFPYQCLHLPWYNDCENLTDEEKYYIESVTKPTHWSK